MYSFKYIYHETIKFKNKPVKYSMQWKEQKSDKEFKLINKETSHTHTQTQITAEKIKKVRIWFFKKVTG